MLVRVRKGGERERERLRPPQHLSVCLEWDAIAVARLLAVTFFQAAKISASPGPDPSVFCMALTAMRAIRALRISNTSRHEQKTCHMGFRMIARWKLGGTVGW